jgi:hypothetical protein
MDRAQRRNKSPQYTRQGGLRISLTQVARYQERYGHVPRWVRRGMGARWERVAALEHRYVLSSVLWQKGWDSSP